MKPYKPLTQAVTSGVVTHAASLQEIAENRIRMIGSTTGTPLRDGSVFAPGAFKKAAKQFVENGLLLVGHDWDDLGIGMIVSAAEKDGALEIEAEFHDTPTAQEARAVCMQRVASGKKVSVSIGFAPDWATVQYFESGKDLLKFVEENGGIDGYDAPAVKKLGWCRIIQSVTEIFEVSLVTVGMNPNAAATEANALTFDDQFNEVLDGLDSLLSRWEGIAELRPKLGETHRTKLGEIVTRLESIAAKAEPAHDAEVNALLPDPAREERLNRLFDRASSITSPKQ